MTGILGATILFVLAAGGMWVAAEQGSLALSGLFGVVIVLVKIGLEAFFGSDSFRIEVSATKFLFGAFAFLLGLILGRMLAVPLSYVATLVVIGVIAHLISDVYIIAHQEDEV